MSINWLVFIVETGSGTEIQNVSIHEIRVVNHSVTHMASGGLSPQKPGFIPLPIHINFPVGSAAQGRGLQDIRFSPFCIILPVLQKPLHPYAYLITRTTEAWGPPESSSYVPGNLTELYSERHGHCFCFKVFNVYVA